MAAIQGTHGSLANASAPHIDGLATARHLSQMMIPNVVQGLVHGNDKGVTNAWFPEQMMYDSARLVMGKPLSQRARTLGEGEGNSYAFNKRDVEHLTTQYYEVKFRHVLDGVIDLAQVSMDMVPLDYANDVLTKIQQVLTKEINAITLATQIASALNHDFDNVDSDVIVEQGVDEKALPTFQRANTKLNDGDTSNFIDTFEVNKRIHLMTNDFWHQLKYVEKAVYDMGNVTGQNMLRLGVLDGEISELEKNNTLNGLQGVIEGVEQRFVTSAIWQRAASILDISLDDILGVVVNSEGTARGIDFRNGVEIDRSPRGQGIRFKPLYRWGVDVIFPESIKLIVKNGFTSPVATEADKLEVFGQETTIA